MKQKSLFFFSGRKNNNHEKDKISNNMLEVNSNYSKNNIKAIFTKVLSIIFIFIGLVILFSGIIIMDLNQMDGKLVIVLSCFVFLSALLLYRENDEKAIADVHEIPEEERREVITHEITSRLVSNTNKIMQHNISQCVEGDEVSFDLIMEKEKILVSSSKGEIGYISKSFSRKLLPINDLKGLIHEISLNDNDKYLISLKIIYTKTLE